MVLMVLMLRLMRMLMLVMLVVLMLRYTDPFWLQTKLIRKRKLIPAGIAHAHMIKVGKVGGKARGARRGRHGRRAFKTVQLVHQDSILLAQVASLNGVATQDFVFFHDQLVDERPVLLLGRGPLALFLHPFALLVLQFGQGFFEFRDNAGVRLLFFLEAFGMLLFALPRVQSRGGVCVSINRSNVPNNDKLTRLADCATVAFAA